MTALAVAALLGALVATALAGLRWLRVAQREHYHAGSAIRFALRWWLGNGPNRLLLGAAVLGVALVPLTPAAGFAASAAIAVGPFGLGLKGRTSKLAWTRRLKTLAGVAAILAAIPPVAGLVLGGLRGGAALAVVVAVLVPVIVDIACAVLAPVEGAKAKKFVEQAKAKLADIGPQVVAITGSYGKTSTKGYVVHLAGSTRVIVPSPASFNNVAGLSRAVNEQLTPGTQVFVAEMGTYGRGEIAALVDWLRPDIAAITAIGPVHLERFGTEDAIVEAKAEIFAHATVAVLNVDDPRLAALADRLIARGQVGDGDIDTGPRRVVRCSAVDEQADVCVTAEGRFLVGGTLVGEVGPVDVQPTNVAVAAAFALELHTPAEVVAARIPTLPPIPNRLAVTTGTTGATILDDTYNSNPAGAAAALTALSRESVRADAARLGGTHRIVVTPGMVELGPRQFEENKRFATAAVEVATHLLIVGRTNQRALQAGAADGHGRGGAQVVLMPTRPDAVEWVRQRVGPGDVILYENDLPDHFA